MTDPMPADSIEYWDAATRTYYERQEDGAVISRPYNDEENAQADAKANRAVLVEQLVSATATNAGDIVANAAFLSSTEALDSALLAQVTALTQQSSHQAESLCAVSRLILGRLESTESPIAP